MRMYRAEYADEDIMEIILADNDMDALSEAWGNGKRTWNTFQPCFARRGLQHTKSGVINGTVDEEEGAKFIPAMKTSEAQRKGGPKLSRTPTAKRTVLSWRMVALLLLVLSGIASTTLARYRGRNFLREKLGCAPIAAFVHRHRAIKHVPAVEHDKVLPIKSEPPNGGHRDSVLGAGKNPLRQLVLGMEKTASEDVRRPDEIQKENQKSRELNPGAYLFPKPFIPKPHPHEYFTPLNFRLLNPDLPAPP